MPATNRRDVPDHAKQTVDRCEMFGCSGWTFEYEYKLPDENRRIQVRTEEHISPPAQVILYRDAMKRGEKFPPIIMTKDNFIVSGNTRVAAARKAGFPDIQAIVLKEAWEGSPPDVQRRLRLLGAGDNTRHGKGIDHTEIRDAVLFVGANSGYDATQVAALLNITAPTVTNIFNEKLALDHLKGLGVDVPVGSLGLSQLRKLGANVLKIHDEPFASLTRLAQASKMSPTELGTVIDKVKATGSDEAAMSLLKEEWSARQDAMDMVASTGGKVTKTKSFELRESLKFVLEHNAADFIEMNQEFAPEHVDQLQRAIALLQQAVELQERRMARAPMLEDA
jgi:hypothetical protein